MFKNYKITLILAISLIFVFSSIGLGVKYEGPLPEDFNQAPMLDEQVESGELPPVEERLPDNPYVVDPNEEIGQYGGTIRTTTLSPEGYGDDTILSSWPAPAKSTADASEVVPHLFEDWDISDDYKEFTFYLREGVKWSDGHPFTTDDIMFWYEDVLLNEDLTAVVGLPWKVDGELVEVNQIDDYTIKFEFPVTRPFFINRAVKFGAWDFFMPKHYLKQFHPEYTPIDEVEEKADEEGFDEWYEYFWDRQSNVWGMPTNPDLPGLTPYVLERKSSDRRIWKRNPYFWKVDPEGNQLPYIDKIDTEIATDLEVVQGMILSGDLDFAGMQTDIRNYPMYRNYEKDGNFRTILWETGMGSDVIYMFNLTHEDSGLREVFQDVNFRRAMSLAIDRDEISESIYFGRAEPRQFTVVDSSKYF
ncbi:MAG: ABC transporter substrate-binding protein, partial [bacterium]